jgi:hypothetical protein
MRISLFSKSRRLYAYMCFKAYGRNRRFYVGDVTAETRDEALAKAWTIVQVKGLRKKAATDVQAGRNS